MNSHCTLMPLCTTVRANLFAKYFKVFLLFRLKTNKRKWTINIIGCAFVPPACFNASRHDTIAKTKRKLYRILLWKINVSEALGKRCLKATVARGANSFWNVNKIRKKRWVSNCFRGEKAKDKFDLSFSFYLRAKIYIQATKVRESSLYNCVNVNWNNEMFLWVSFHSILADEMVKLCNEDGKWLLKSSATQLKPRPCFESRIQAMISLVCLPHHDNVLVRIQSRYYIWEIFTADILTHAAGLLFNVLPRVLLSRLPERYCSSCFTEETKKYSGRIIETKQSAKPTYTL